MKVKILTHTPNPEKIIAMAGKLCYAGCSIDELEENLTEEEINKFVNMLIKIGHCYDEKTEVLTSNGFVPFSQVTYDTKVACVDPQTRNFCGFENPKLVINKEVEENLIRIQNKNIDLFITNGHKLYCSLSSSSKTRINPQFKLIEANKTIVDKSGKENPVYKKPMRMAKCSVNSNLYICPNDSWYKLYGFFVGDGHTNETGNRLEFHLKLDRKIQYLINICKEIGINVESKASDKYIIYSDNISSKFRNMFYNDVNEKTFPINFLNMSNNQYKCFMEGLRNSDGSNKRSTWVYDSTSLINNKCCFVV
jgi:hypothetical protein